MEFRSIEEAKAGYALNNVSVLGQPLRVGRPRTYAGNEPPVVSGLHALGASAIGLNKVTEEMASKILGGKGRLMLSGLPHGYNSEDIKTLLQEFGTLKCMDMPKDPLTGLTKGYTIFDYDEEEATAKVLQQGTFKISGCTAIVSRVGKERLTGMKFNEKRVECVFHPEELFFQGNFVGE